MSTTLTKKQQKAQAFRAKQRAKKSGKGETEQDEVPEVDLLEDDVPAETEATIAESSSSSSKKRKREGEEEKEPKASAGKGKGKKTAWDDEEQDGDAAKKTKKDIKQRFILFVGNLGFKTTRDAVQNHFKPVLTQTPSVRLLTTKATPTVPAKSRGIAFLEVPTSTDLQACLKLHHSTLDGRRINVELTAGGGGKSEARQGKITERNERVGVQRERKAEKEKEDGTGDAGAEQARESIQSEPVKRKRVEGQDGVVDGPDGKVKIRGGRRVKVKTDNTEETSTKQTDKAQLSGWTSRTAGGGRGQQAARGGRGRGGAPSGRRKFEPTGANAVFVK
ncbi:hypothetical protein BCR39DRAFT_482486 [Naematelia encephala]|uniref:RRM domain-containing protein n=1 Tax=Naematelia encephala TaxID=71784 RepID=A0A1Y2B1W7_9TREE|nr:hypothetical protein BCR39DRAFT_482486 [Naematelia encephala]